MSILRKLLLVITVCFYSALYGQKNLTVKIVNSKKAPVPGAVIFLDKIQQRRVANNQGVFKIKLLTTPKTITAYSPIYGSFSHKYNGEENITINLPFNNKKNSSSLFVSAKKENYNNIYEYLIDNSTDIIINKEKISISGIHPKYKSRTPLLIINGVIVGVETFSKLKPKAIQEIRVLKGPQAARWGLQGSAGVIEVKVNTE